MCAARVITADRGDAGRRIDLVIRRHLAGLDSASRTHVQAWIEAGLVTVNEVPVRRVATRAACGDVIAVTVPAEPRRAPIPAEDVPLAILYEDEYLLAIDKPAGMVAHPTFRHADGTLLNALLGRARTWPSPQRPSLVGRLDKLTSGIVVVAKSVPAHAALQRAMAANDAQKDYLAVVYGRVNVGRGRIELRLGKDQGDRRKVVASETTGAPSLTRFERLARVAAPRGGLSLVGCRLVTGRTHQIRVHLAARGWPIVGDPLYGEARWSRIVDPALRAALHAFPRQALHAWRLGLTHPFTGGHLAVEAPLPDDIQELLRASGLTLAHSDRR